MKKLWKSFLSKTAVVLGVIVWLSWIVIRHNKNIKDAESIINIEKPMSYERASQAAASKKAVKKEAILVTKKLEKQTKQEIIDAFKEAFNIIPSTDIQ